MKAGSRTRRTRRSNACPACRCDVRVGDGANFQYAVNLSPDGGANHDESAPLRGADGGDLVGTGTERSWRAVVDGLTQLPVDAVTQPERIERIGRRIHTTYDTMVHRDDGGGVEVGLDVVIGSAR